MRQAKKSTGRVEDICCLQCLAYATFVAERVVQCSAVQYNPSATGKEREKRECRKFLPSTYPHRARQ